MIIKSIIILLMVTISTLFGFWMIHVSLIKQHIDEYGWVTFKTFMKHFKKYEWRRDVKDRTSYFHLGTNGNSMVHAWIIKFDEKGMILYPHSFFRFLLWNQMNKLKKHNIKW